MEKINLNIYLSLDNYCSHFADIFKTEREKNRRNRIQELNEQLNDLNQKTILNLNDEETRLLRIRLGMFNNGKEVTYKKISEILNSSQSQIINRLNKIYEKIRDSLYLEDRDYTDALALTTPINKFISQDILPEGITNSLSENTSLVEFLNIRLDYIKKMCTIDEFNRLIDYIHSKDCYFVDELETKPLRDIEKFQHEITITDDLRKNGIFTINDLINLTKEEFVNLKNTSEKEKKYIKRLIRSLKLNLKGEKSLVDLTKIKLVNDSSIYSEYTNIVSSSKNEEEQPIKDEYYSKIKRLQEIQKQILLLQQESIELTLEIEQLLNEKKIGDSNGTSK